jgi:hypothetical protein
MRILYSPVFILCCILFVVHQILQKFLKITIPLADYYLDNLLIIPILLTLLVVERRIIFRRGNDYTLSGLEVIMATVLISLVSEFLFPYLSKNFTSDGLDVVFHILGSVVFYTTINKYK